MSSQSKNKNSNKILLAVLLFLGAAAYFLINSGVVDPSEGTRSGIRGVEKADKNISKNDVVVELDDNYLEDQINNATQNNVIEKNKVFYAKTSRFYTKIMKLQYFYTKT